MKKGRRLCCQRQGILLAGLGVCFGLVGCGQLDAVVHSLPELSETIANTVQIIEMPKLKRIGSITQDTSDAWDEGTSLFNELTVSDAPKITADLDVWLGGDIAEFMSISVKEDTTAVIRYTYTTQNQGAAELGVYPTSDDEVTYFQLKEASDEDYTTVWTEKEVTLEKGENLFYVSGQEVTCKMHFEITQIDNDLVESVTGF